MPGEHRVAVTPNNVARLSRNYEVWVEGGAGKRAGFDDERYAEAGATVIDDLSTLYEWSDIILKVRRPIWRESIDRHEAELIREGATLIALMQPLTSPDLLLLLAQRRVTAFALELVPHNEAADALDVRAHQSALAGYRAALIAAASDRFVPALIAGAALHAPGVLVIGAGGMGLQAVATMRRLGASVTAFDIRGELRPAVEALGANFVTLELSDVRDRAGYAKPVTDEVRARERALLQPLLREADVVIAAANVPGKAAPKLITREMVEDMKPGATIVDMGAEKGCNCEVAEPGREVRYQGITIHAPVELASAFPYYASRVFSHNLVNFLYHVAPAHNGVVDLDDGVTRACCVTHAGEVLFPEYTLV
jgi:NAD(P) transhydrogenase subunit alpha